MQDPTDTQEQLLPDPQPHPRSMTPSEKRPSLSSRYSTRSVQKSAKRLSNTQQFGLLYKKNLRVFARNPGFFIYHVVILAAVLGWMILISYLMRNQSSLVRVKSYSPETLGGFSKCKVKDTKCLTLGVALVDEDPSVAVKDWIDEAISSISNTYGLEKEKDYKMLYRGSNYEELYDEMQEFDEIKSMVTFCNEFLFFQNSTMSLSCDEATYSFFSLDVNLYGIHYNSTVLAPNFLRDTGTPIESDRNAILLKQTIDQVIINHFDPARLSMKERILGKREREPICRARFGGKEDVSGSKLLTPESVRARVFADEEIFEAGRSEKEANLKAENGEDGVEGGLTGGVSPDSERVFRKPEESVADSGFEYDISIMNYPKPKNRFIDKFDSSNEWGSFFYLFIILLSYIKFAQLIAREKDQKLRKGLIPLGLSNFSYWTSWLGVIMIFDMIFIAILIGLGAAIGFPIFVEITPVLTYSVLLLCLWTYRFLAVLVVVCTDDFRAASKANYTVLIVSLFLQSKAVFIIWVCGQIVLVGILSMLDNAVI